MDNERVFHTMTKDARTPLELPIPADMPNGRLARVIDVEPGRELLAGGMAAIYRVAESDWRLVVWDLDAVVVWGPRPYRNEAAAKALLGTMAIAGRWGRYSIRV